MQSKRFNYFKHQILYDRLKKTAETICTEKKESPGCEKSYYSFCNYLHIFDNYVQMLRLRIHAQLNVLKYAREKHFVCQLWQSRHFILAEKAAPSLANECQLLWS